MGTGRWRADEADLVDVVRLDSGAQTLSAAAPTIAAELTGARLTSST